MANHIKSLSVKAAGAVIVNPKNKVLIMLKKMTHTWEFPQGTVEEGEKILETLHREIQEETGIQSMKIIPGFRTRTNYSFMRDGVLYTKTVIYFLVKTKERVALSGEHTKYRWCAPEEAEKLFRHKNHHDVLREAMMFLSKDTR